MICSTCKEPITEHRYMQNSRMYLGVESFIVKDKTQISEHGLTNKESDFYWTQWFGSETATSNGVPS